MELATTNWFDGRPLVLSECTDCRLVRASPRPVRSDVYRNHLIGTEKAVQPIKKKLSRTDAIEHHRRAIEVLMEAAHRPIKKLYHVGCEAGIVLMAAQALGIEGEGNDANLVSIKMLRELGFKVHHGFVGDLNFPVTKSDAVMSLGQLGASYEPFQDLKRSHSLLDLGGAMYLKTPYLGCPDHTAYGQAWKNFGGSSVHYFYPETLRAMIRGAGFELLDMRLLDMAAIVLAVREN
jgi:hypothetical protein